MITEREKKALHIAKRAYQHFTKDALEIAMEIIALEREMAEDQEKPVTIPMNIQPEPTVKTMVPGVLPASLDIQTKPPAEVNSIRVAGPLNYPRMQADEQPAKREFEEIPY
jgi:uncharacterized pyridoxal phosphate-containing UPF0001 family protein